MNYPRGIQQPKKPTRQAARNQTCLRLKKRTLTNLYNQRSTWLELAHRKLDEAVLDAYGWPHDPSAGQVLSDEDILARLLALNLERAKGQKT